MSFLVGKRLQFVTFYYEKGTICQFASNLTKLCHWNPRSVPIKDSKIPWPGGRFPGFYCPTQWSTASAIARIRISRQVLYLRRGWTTARITAVVLNMICSVYSARGKEKRPRPATKLLLSALIKAQPAKNLKLKKRYEK